MNFTQLLNSNTKPKIFSKGTSVMWTDEHISKQLLDIHLNPDIDLASRKKTSIDKTLDWVQRNIDKQNLDILDLGCGPGLYTEILAKKGHTVSGVDFSQNSINYAKKQAKTKGLKINYKCRNYLNIDFSENSFDLVILIFTDFGVLNPKERNTLLKIISKILKPGGMFIFDVVNDKEIKPKLSPKNWEVSDSGFWKDRPYLALSESFMYEDEKVILFQHTVIDEKDNNDIYRFWTSLFSQNELEKLLTEHSFSGITFSENILPSDNTWTGEYVTFCKATNNK